MSRQLPQTSQVDRYQSKPLCFRRHFIRYITTGRGTTTLVTKLFCSTQFSCTGKFNFDPTSFYPSKVQITSQTYLHYRSDDREIACNVLGSSLRSTSYAYSKSDKWKFLSETPFSDDHIFGVYLWIEKTLICLHALQKEAVSTPLLPLVLIDFLSSASCILTWQTWSLGLAVWYGQNLFSNEWADLCLLWTAAVDQSQFWCCPC